MSVWDIEDRDGIVIAALIIAAMTGDTGGGGLELSLNCDIRIMQRGDYLLGFLEASLGILTGTGSQLLERAIGRSRALDFLLRSRYVTPEGALELGIVNELADDARARRPAVRPAPRLGARPRGVAGAGHGHRQLRVPGRRADAVP
ncbi:MAG: enoyl-CoA hydratase/isomerase family protein [Solirubrobacterales bacterium]